MDGIANEFRSSTDRRIVRGPDTVAVVTVTVVTAVTVFSAVTVVSLVIGKAGEI